VYTINVYVPTVQPIINEVANDACILSDGRLCQRMEVVGGNGSQSSTNYQMWYTLDDPVECTSNSDCPTAGQSCRNGFCTSSPSCSSGSGSYQYDGTAVVVENQAS